jgi:two-component system, cell cycle sensor histidine kinase and response regulator CckA
LTKETKRDAPDADRGTSTADLELEPEQYRAALQHAPLGTCLVSLEGRFLSVNRALSQMLGYEEAELVGREVAAITFPEDVNLTECWLRDLVNHPIGRTEFEKRYLHRQGHVVCGIVSVQLLRGANGQPRFFLSHVEDITERKRAEAALRESEERFRIAFDNAPTGMSIIAPNGSYLAVNPRLCRMFGLGREELLRGTIAVVTHPDDIERSNEWIRKKMRNEACEEDFEKRFIHQDGHVVWGRVRAQWIRDETGALRMAVAHILDISERKRAEEALVESERRLREAHEVAKLAHWSFDTADRTLSWGEDVERLFEIDSEPTAMTLERFASLIHPDDRIEIASAHRVTVEQGIPYDVVLRLQLPNGRVKFVRVIGRREQNAAGQPRRITGILQDVTSLKRAEAERAELETQLHRAQKMEAIGHLAGGIAHDFNNLLTAIGGNASLALTDVEPDAPLHTLLTEITTAVDSAANLTRQLLTFSRQQIISPKVLSLNDVVTHIKNMLRRLLGEDLELVTRLAPELGHVRIDVSQVEQILVNLAVNARDAMPDGGRLTVETRNIELDEDYCLEHGQAMPGHYVMLAVSDNGTGMTRETMLHIFEPFFTTKEQGKGTGLGLAMVYGAVRQNDGLVDVYSELGQGTTFKIYLPCVDAPAEPIRPNVARSLAPGRETIILVEDEPMVRALAQRVLVRQGYRVHAFSSGDAALADLPRLVDGFDLIVTDVVMPGLNGRVFAERARALRPAAKVIFTSGYTQNVIAYHGVLDAGIEFLPKPYTVAMLVSRVREVLDQK